MLYALAYLSLCPTKRILYELYARGAFEPIHRSAVVNFAHGAYIFGILDATIRNVVV